VHPFAHLASVDCAHGAEPRPRRRCSAVKCAFAGWQKALRDDCGQLRRSLWETALALAVRDALRSGDLHLPHSRQHAGFWSLVLDERLWASSRTACYADLGLSDRPAEHLALLAREIGSAATAFADGLATNSFARIDQGQLSLSRPDALTVTAELRSLRRLIESRMPRIRLKMSCWMSTGAVASPVPSDRLPAMSRAARIPTARCSLP
jgi:hypothetical protein